MKILVISNYYPPHYVGGYELGCRTVVEQLAARGHTLRVLTGTYRVDAEYAGPEDGSDSGIRVDRILHLDSGPGGSPTAGRFHIPKQCGLFRRVVGEFQPDIIYFWNLSGLCLWLPTCALLMGKKCAFFISDSSFVAWRIGAVLFRFVRDTPRTRAGALLQRLIRAVFGGTWLVCGYPVLFQRPCHFASAFLQNLAQREDIDFHGQSSDVIHWGIDVARFTPPEPPSTPPRWPARKLLYVGQVIPQKGVHTAVEAMVLLAKTPGFEEMTLTIAGGSSNPEYEQQLRSLPLNLGVVDRVEFLGRISSDDLPAVYHAHDVLVFPSTWDEPFAITPLEAMAAGLPVVGTLTGGSGEIFRQKETAMTFEAGNAIACATAVVELCSSRTLFESIRAEARERVATRHTLSGMVDRIEGDLKSIANSGDPA